MITLITGATGAGKTFLMVKMARIEWKKGADLFSNFPVWFDEARTGIGRWHNLDELYGLNNGIILIDDGQRLFDARRWASLPPAFAEKIALSRHDHIDVITNTQDISHIDVRIRQNVHELFACQSLLRIPKNDRVKPIFQWIRYVKKMRVKSDDTERIIWRRSGRPRWIFLSKFWTKTYFDTYTNFGLTRYVCKTILKNKVWLLKCYSRHLVNSGKARL
jgi:hypothetical protein